MRTTSIAIAWFAAFVVASNALAEKPKQMKIMPGVFGSNQGTKPKLMQPIPGAFGGNQPKLMNPIPGAFGGNQPKLMNPIPGALSPNTPTKPKLMQIIPGVFGPNTGSNNKPNDNGKKPKNDGLPGKNWGSTYPGSGNYIPGWWGTYPGPENYRPQQPGWGASVPGLPPQHHVEFLNETPFEVVFLYRARVYRLIAGQGIALRIPHPEDVAFRVRAGEPAVHRPVHAGAYRFVYSDQEGLGLHRID